MDRYPSNNEPWHRGISPESFSGPMGGYDSIGGSDDFFSHYVLPYFDLLPRKEFFGKLIRNIHTESDKAQKRFELLSNASLSAPSENLYIDGRGIRLTEVCPDGLIESTDSLCVLMVRRHRSELVKPSKWAGGLVLAHQHSPDKLPLLLVVFRVPPPIIVKSIGLLALPEIIRLGLSEICDDPGERDLYEESITESVGWVTWDEIGSCIEEGLQLIESATYPNKDEIVRTARVMLLILSGYRNDS